MVATRVATMAVGSCSGVAGPSTPSSSVPQAAKDAQRASRVRMAVPFNKFCLSLIAITPASDSEWTHMHQAAPRANPERTILGEG